MLRVKEIAREKGLTMSDVAKRMDISPSGLSMALSRNVTMEVLERIAKALQVKISDLFEEPSNISGFIKVKGVIYEIRSFEDLEKILKLREKENGKRRDL